MSDPTKRRELTVDTVIPLLVVLAGALAVLLVGLHLGPHRYLSRGGGPWVGILPATFDVWESRRPGEHFFLAFLDPDDVAAGTAYGHYSQPLLLLQYALLQPARWLRISYQRSQVALCLPHFGLIILLLLTHLRGVGTIGLRPVKPLPLLRLGVITMAAAGVMTLPALWIPFFRFNPEQYFFLPAFAFCYLGAADYRGTLRTRDALLTMVPIALFAPVFTPFAVVSWVILWELGSKTSGPVRWRAITWLGAIALLGVIVFALPSLIGRFSAFTVTGSRLGFRSGLDGDQRHFISMLQALWAPSYPPGRAWLLWQWPAVALAAVAAVAASSRATAAKMARQLFISWIPVLWMVIVFPQLVSVHPYYFDFHITLGAAFCLVFWLQLPELQHWIELPAVRLAVLMVCAALVMTNLIDLARFGVMPIE